MESELKKEYDDMGIEASDEAIAKCKQAAHTAQLTFC